MAEKDNRQENQVYQEEKMEAIGTLAGGIAHRFNNIIGGIIGNISLMRLEIDPTHPHHERLLDVEKEIQRMAKLASQLIGYARRGRYDVKTVDLNEMVKSSVDDLTKSRNGIEIRLKLKDVLPVELDVNQIKEVLQAVLINAAEAMPKDGVITVKTRNTAHYDMKGICDAESKNNSYVLLAITDMGIGMDRETLKRIFEPFFTTKKMRGEAIGLSLASVYGIVKGHDGYIDVESEKEQGTTFKIYLPASEENDKEMPKAD